ncbi:MAG: DUF4430 domain-containing protein [Ruminococcus sp.]|nr:DUF4430 domain-containing protein [Ruminococcus sp.]
MKPTKTASRLLASVIAMIMCVMLLFSMSACTETPADSDPTVTSTNSVVTTTPDEYASVWANATYTEDKTFGEGANTFDFEVVVGEHSVTFTINTDETVVGKALLANELVSGDEGDYGLYVKTVNGMLADYDVDASYWAFYQDGEMMMTGVDMTDIESGAHYEMVYTK